MGIFDIFSTKDQEQAAQDQIAGLQKGYSQLSDLFGQGRDALTTNYSAALQPFTADWQGASAGVDQLKALLGFGPNGSAGIQDTLKNLPGYQFALDQGSQNVLRNANATGAGISGGTLAALQKQGQGLADQNYFNYAAQLMPFLTAQSNAATGIGGVNTGLGNQLNQSFMTQGNAAYGTQAGIGNAQAQADLAGLTQSGNIFGAGLGALTAGIGLFSDKDVKDDIEPVGELFDGQTIYRYRYKGDPRHQIGLIAQEVEEERPSAVIHNFAGTKFRAVNYKEATNYAAELGRMMEAA